MQRNIERIRITILRSFLLLQFYVFPFEGLVLSKHEKIEQGVITYKCSQLSKSAFIMLCSGAGQKQKSEY